jgi:hypothetical protein
MLRLRQQARRKIMRELDRCSERRCGSVPKARPMRCYFNLVDAHRTILDYDGVEAEDLDQVHRLAVEWPSR